MKDLRIFLNQSFKEMKNKKAYRINSSIIVLLMILFINRMGVHAQTSDFRISSSVLPINLESVLKLAGANNLTIKEYELIYQQSLAEQAKAKEWWLPELYFGTTTHYMNGAAMNADGKIFQPVSRNNLWTGLGFSTDWDFSKGIYGTLAAKQKADAIKFKSQAERNQAILKAIETYFNLQFEQFKYIALQQLVNQSDSLAQQIKIQVDAGIRYQSEYLLAQSNFHHFKISLLQTKTEWQKKSAELVNLLNIQANTILASSDNAIAPIQLSINVPDTSMKNKIYEKRPEFFSFQAGLLALQTERKTATTGLLMPKFRLGTEDGFLGRAQSPYFNTFQVNAALLWQIPLGRFIYMGDLKKQDANILRYLNQMEQFKNKVGQEVSIGTTLLQSLEEQRKVAGDALKFSAEALQQSIERQKLGTTKPFEVFQAQQFYMQSQVDYLQTISEYNKTQYNLLVILGGNL